MKSQRRFQLSPWRRTVYGTYAVFPLHNGAPSARRHITWAIMILSWTFRNETNIHNRLDLSAFADEHRSEKYRFSGMWYLWGLLKTQYQPAWSYAPTVPQTVIPCPYSQLEILKILKKVVFNYTMRTTVRALKSLAHLHIDNITDQTHYKLAS